MLGQRLANRYEIVAELGRGGMGAVYRAHDPVLGRDVAVKVIPPQLLSDEAEKRFRREARAVAALDHQGIVSVHDFGHHDNSLFLVMSLVRGYDLRTLMEEHSLNEPEILDVAMQVANALDCAHRSGIVHRDVKPENILIDRDEEGVLRARVTDFGLAIADHDERLTLAGMVVGTVAYLAPEQVTQKAVDGRADIYALGTILYEAFAGRVPFDGPFTQIFIRIANETPASIRTMGIDIPTELDSIIMRCLAKERDDRPQSARELAETLEQIRGDMTGKKVPRRAETTAKRPLRTKTANLVGRAAEFETLRSALVSVASGEGRVVLVGGATGVGKTRLVDELERVAVMRDVPVFRARCVDFDNTLPYNTLCQIIQQYVRVRASDAGRQFADLAPELTQVLPLLADIREFQSTSSATTTTTAGTASTPLRDDRTYIFELLARAYIRMSDGKPMGIIFEDLHLANVTVDALQYIVHRLGPFPILILGTFRSDEVDRQTPITRLLDNFHGDRRFELVSIEPFTLAEHREFLQHLVGSNAIDEQVVQRTFAVTDGNAHFTSELTRSLMDSGEIARQSSGIWTLAHDAAISLDALPASIQQAVERRLDRLPKEQREVLGIASALGREFNVRELQAIAEDAKSVDDDLDQLLAAGFLEEVPLSRGDRMIFSSGVVREVVYGTLSRRRRRTLHRTFAEWLERRNAGRLEMVYPQLVHHYAEGDVPEKVIEFGMKLARKSIDAFAEQDAINAANAVITFVEDPVARAEARALLAEAYRLTSETSRALEEIDAAVRLFAGAGAKTKELAAMCTAADTAWQGRRVDETRRWVERGIPLARELGDSSALSRLVSLAAIIANLRADYAAARRYLSEAPKLQPMAEDESQHPRGGVLRVALATAVRAGTSLRIDDEPEVLANIRETLLTTDEHGAPVPHLCERWAVDDDGQTYALVLREGVRFHDGTLLDAGHVKRSIEAAITQRKNGWDALAGAVEGVVDGQSEIGGLIVRSPRQLEIRLKRRLAMLPSLLSSPDFTIFRAAGEADPTIGTGPFRIATADSDSVTLVRFNEHWLRAPRIDRLEMRLGITGGEATARFRSRDVDLIRDLSPAEIEAILEERHLRAVIAEAAKKNVYLAILNQQRPLGANALIRRAVLGVVRIEQLVRRTLNRLARPATGLFPPGIAGHDAGRRLRAAPMEQVREWIAQSGETTPIRLRAAVHPALLDRCGAFTRALIDAWKEVGIEVSIDTADATPYLEKVTSATDVDLVLGKIAAEYADPHACVAAFHSRNGLFGKLAGSEEIDALIERGTMTVDPARRERVYGEIEFLLGAAILPLFHDIDCRVCSPAVRGLHFRSSAPYINYDAVAVARDREEAGAAPHGGVLHVPMMYEIATLDPVHYGDLWQAHLASSVFETLTRTNDRGVVVPWLATSFDVDDSARTCRFVLRDDVLFHDGRKMTARDVRYSFERFLRRGAEKWNPTLLASIEGASEVMAGSGELTGMRIESDTELVVTLKGPVAFFPAILTFPSLAIVPEGTEEIEGTWRQSCIGTGPFRVSRFDPGRFVELEANPYYWRENLPRAEGLVAWLGVPAEEIAPRFRSGRISLAYEVPPADYRALRHDTSLAASYSEAPVLATSFLAFNVHSPLFRDREARERVAAALDLGSLVRLIDPRVAPATGIFPPGLLGHDPLPRSKPKYVGGSLKNNTELLVGVYSVFARIYDAFVDAAIERLRQIGFVPEIAGGRKLLYERNMNTGLLFTRWVYDYPDSDSFVRGILDTSSGAVGWACGSPKIDQLIVRGCSETNRDLRHEIYREIDEIVSGEMRLLPLFHEQAYCFSRPEVHGLHMRQFYPFVSFEEFSVER